jgi:hypothetical protein
LGSGIISTLPSPPSVRANKRLLDQPEVLQAAEEL